MTKLEKMAREFVEQSPHLWGTELEFEIWDAAWKACLREIENRTAGVIFPYESQVELRGIQRVTDFYDNLLRAFGDELEQTSDEQMTKGEDKSLSSLVTIGPNGEGSGNLDTEHQKWESAGEYLL